MTEEIEVTPRRIFFEDPPPPRNAERAQRQYEEMMVVTEEAYMQAAAIDLVGATVAQQMRLGLDAVADAISGLGGSGFGSEASIVDALESIAEAITAAVPKVRKASN